MLCEGAVEHQPLLSAEVHSDILQPTLEEMSPTSIAQEQGQRRGDRGFYPTASENSPVSHGQVFQGSGYPSDPVNRNESQSGSTEQPTSDAVHSAPLEDRQTLPQAVDSHESITVEIDGCTVDQEGSSAQPSRIDNCSEERNSSAAHPVIKPLEAVSIPTTSDKEQQIAWASKQVENFEAEIHKLKNNVTTRSRNITSIEHDIENSQNDYNKHLQDKEEEIARVLRELEEQHSRKCEAFKSKLLYLKESKQSELRTLERYVLEVSRKENGLMHFQAIVDYYNHEEDNDGDMARVRGGPLARIAAPNP
jgi:hypothetical protein